MGRLFWFLFVSASLQSPNADPRILLRAKKRPVCPVVAASKMVAQLLQTAGRCLRFCRAKRPKTARKLLALRIWRSKCISGRAI